MCYFDQDGPPYYFNCFAIIPSCSRCKKQAKWAFVSFARKVFMWRQKRRFTNLIEIHNAANFCQIVFGGSLFWSTKNPWNWRELDSRKISCHTVRQKIAPKSVPLVQHDFFFRSTIQPIKSLICSVVATFVFS